MRPIMHLPPGLEIDDIVEAAQLDRGTGFCLKCGEERDGFTESDAEYYPCDNCGENQVFGAMQLILMYVP